MASLQKNVASQNFTFALVNATTGAALTGATVAIKAAKDNVQGAGAGTVTELGSGQYNYAPTQGETNGTDVGFLFTATNAIPVNVDFHTDPANFLSLSIDSSGNVSLTSNVKKNAALSGFTFTMTDSTTHAPKTGLTVTAQRSINGAALGSCANSVSELSNGNYVINLAAADLNGNVIMLRFTATGADDLNILLVTQP